MKNILCYGDSNTHGRIPGTTNGRYERNVRWTGRLQEILGDDFHVIEEGLGGRTAAFNDPIDLHMSGIDYLVPCLNSHRPLDYVILSLGTNDMKKRFSLPPIDISIAIGNLVRKIKNSECGQNGNIPEIIIISPPAIKDVNDKRFHEMFEGGFEKSKSVYLHLKEIAEKEGAILVNTENYTSVSDIDGIHFNETSHAIIAKLIAEVILNHKAETNACLA